MSEPKRIKHYEILARLGEGGMGVVYRARDTRLGRIVALKTLHRELSSDDERSRRFEREARIVSTMSHPGIATLYDFDREGETLYLTMELVEGPTLRTLLRDGPLPVEQLLECGVQIADALAAAHREGVIHRDLKPENIMLSDSGFYKVLDFGVARVHELSRPKAERSTHLATRSWATSAGGLVGTVAYMSPEQAMGEPVDARSDIFAAGALLYEIASGKPAFRGNNAIATAEAIANRDPIPLNEQRPGLPRGLDWIVAKCLAKRPEDRYQSAAALAEDLRTLQLESLTTSGRGRRRLLARTAKREPNRRWWFAGASLLVLAGLAWIGWIGQAGPETDSGSALPRSAAAPNLLASDRARPRIVVAFFDNQSGDSEADWLSRGLPEMLTTDLSRSGGLEVIATQRLSDLAAAASGGGSEALDRASVTELARWAGASVVISGAVFRLGTTYRIDAQAYDTADGTVLVARKVEGNDLFQMVDQLTRGLREGLSLAAGGVGQGGVTTSSPEAFRLYTQGKQLYDALRFDEAAARLENAIEVDPGFELARLRLALSLHALGERAPAVSLVEELLAEDSALPEPEMLLARAFRAFYADGDAEQGSRILTQLESKYPGHPMGNVLWAEGLFEISGDPMGATRKLRAAVAADPNNLRAIAALASQLVRFGDPVTADAILREAAQRHPEAAAALEELVRVSDDAPS